MGLPRIYLETSVVSYLTAWPSRDLVLAARQQMTREWWDKQRSGFESFVSQLVLEEAAAGDAAAMKSRIDAVAGFLVLDVTPEAERLAAAMIRARLIPETVAADALHVACATVHRMHYLLTWNCKHLAHARVRQEVRDLVAARGYDPVEICTPEELMEG